ncbi:type 1 glutamine amidotransferase [Acidipropionibacterium jensenii]|uniref:type 1 glutamine amidotransferase n=1 Tax=Acidipropionibacterium jensenii TaxID=1749 RepID=UPI000BC36255|nr:type 1 glutamine amidotransferase [Acidipropionibacterium jensenii]AZZ41205.1 type 1 glutamine amidotransferase [Acidipropionibacterium jensenii]
MHTAPTVLVVVNSPTSGPRRLRGWLEADGLEICQHLASEGLPEDLSGIDGLIMLGGGLMPDEFDRAPWLHGERTLALSAIAEDLPTLGICLGGQLLADVAGGQVRAKTGPKERGATLIHATADGASDPVIGGLGSGTPMIENHQDMITELPPDAVLLASSKALANQAFRLGDHVRGLQFHPEASAESLAGWDEAALTADGFSRDELVAEAQRVDAVNTAAARRLVNAFAAEVRAAFEERR